MNGKNKARAIKSYCLPVIRYIAGVISCPKEEIEATDIKKIKILIILGGLHLNPCIQGLYTK